MAPTAWLATLCAGLLIAAFGHEAFKLFLVTGTLQPFHEIAKTLLFFFQPTQRFITILIKCCVARGPVGLV